MCGQATAAQSLSCEFRIGSGRKEVATQGEKDFGHACMHGLNRVHSVVAMFARRFEIKLCAQPVEKRARRPLPNTHGAVPLHVAVPANWT